jgi:glyoxylase-like metal-dependent hydrolase (beta-lactamase superfamily II)
MVQTYHLNCVKIFSPISSNACGHCVLINENDRLVLIDTGIGLLDTSNPIERIGQQLIDIVGYRFDENLTAIKQIEKLGLSPDKVTDCIISHLDNDHIGGLADFPRAVVHIGIEEFENYNSENPRYLKTPLSHNPTIKTYQKSDFNWFGFEARKVNIDIETEIYLVPLFGHTLGHCGVAFKTGKKWLFYIADAYYMRLELMDSNHPVNELAKIRADDDNLRIESLNRIHKLINEHPEIEVFGYHDIEEFEKYKNESYKNNL